MVKIFTDSTSDLSKELLEKYNIGVIPLYIHLGDEEYKDGEEIGIQDPTTAVLKAKRRLA